MSYVILGGGLVGTEAARILQNRGERVTIIARSSREILPNLFSQLADARSASDLNRIEPNPTAVINSLNAPNYTKWAEEFPPLNRGALEYSFKHRAPLVSVSNIYMYESDLGPIGSETPISDRVKKGQIRQSMWEETLEYVAKGLEAAEVRASDYIAKGEQSPLGDRFTKELIKGKSPSVIGSTTAKHSWSAPIDVARTLVAILDQKKFGRVWHVPTNEPRSFQEVADEICNVLGTDKLPAKSIPKPLFYAIGLFSPIVKELRETAFQFEKDFVINDQPARKELGLEPTTWEQLVRSLIDSYQN
jgi:nucleoside-diphosphate-sugar epimerase